MAFFYLHTYTFTHLLIYTLKPRAPGRFPRHPQLQLLILKTKELACMTKLIIPLISNCKNTGFFRYADSLMVVIFSEIR